MSAIEQLLNTWPVDQLISRKQEFALVSNHIIEVAANQRYLDSRLPKSTKLGVIISGPSGAGKDEFVKGLEATNNFVRVVTHTDRRMRPGERNGVDYHFVSPTQFSQMVTARAFFEASPYAGHRKGIARDTVEEVLQQHKIPIFRIDPQGAVKLLKMWTDGNFFQDYAMVNYFIMPESEAVLRQRLQIRDNDTGRMTMLAKDLNGITVAHYVVLNNDGEANEAIAEVCGLTESLLQKMPRLTGQSHICI